MSSAVSGDRTVPHMCLRVMSLGSSPEAVLRGLTIRRGTCSRASAIRTRTEPPMTTFRIAGMPTFVVLSTIMNACGGTDGSDTSSDDGELSAESIAAIEELADKAVALRAHRPHRRAHQRPTLGGGGAPTHHVTGGDDVQHHGDDLAAARS